MNQAAIDLEGRVDIGLHDDAGTLLDIAMTHSDNLINKAQQGDKNAFEKLVKLWYRRIYNFAFKYFGARHRPRYR